MRACLLACLLMASPALAQEQLLSGGELGELRYACFGDDAEEMTGSEMAGLKQSALAAVRAPASRERQVRKGHSASNPEYFRICHIAPRPS